mgnify:CR=1 FL=1
MRQDKLTTKFQEALGEAQSLALAHDNQVIEPVHILAAVLADGEGSSRSLLERAGVNVQSLTREVNAAVERLPKVSGTGGDVQISRDLMNLLNLTEKEAMKRGDEFISTEMLLLALTEDRSEAGRLAKNAGLTLPLKRRSKPSAAATRPTTPMRKASARRSRNTRST